MSTRRAITLRKRFTWAAFTALVLATTAHMLGFDAFFLPFSAAMTVLLARASYWAGWAHGHDPTGLCPSTGPADTEEGAR